MSRRSTRDSLALRSRDVPKTPTPRKPSGGTARKTTTPKTASFTYSYSSRQRYESEEEEEDYQEIEDNDDHDDHDDDDDDGDSGVDNGVSDDDDDEEVVFGQVSPVSQQDDGGSSSPTDEDRDSLYGLSSSEELHTAEPGMSPSPPPKGKSRPGVVSRVVARASRLVAWFYACLYIATSSLLYFDIKILAILGTRVRAIFGKPRLVITALFLILLVPFLARSGPQLLDMLPPLNVTTSTIMDRFVAPPVPLNVSGCDTVSPSALALLSQRIEEHNAKTEARLSALESDVSSSSLTLQSFADSVGSAHKREEDRENSSALAHQEHRAAFTSLQLELDALSKRVGTISELSNTASAPTASHPISDEDLEKITSMIKNGHDEVTQGFNESDEASTEFSEFRGRLLRTFVPVTTLHKTLNELQTQFAEFVKNATLNATHSLVNGTQVTNLIAQAMKELQLEMESLRTESKIGSASQETVESALETAKRAESTAQAAEKSAGETAKAVEGVQPMVEQARSALEAELTALKQDHSGLKSEIETEAQRMNAEIVSAKGQQAEVATKVEQTVTDATAALKRTEELESRLSAVDQSLDKIQKDLERLLKAEDPSEQQKKAIEDLTAQVEAIKGTLKTSLTRPEAQKMIDESMGTFEADKTGMVDYAMEGSGATVATACSSLPVSRPFLVVMGYSMYSHPTSSHRALLSPDMSLGNCWSFVGTEGFITIRLSVPIFVSHVTLEHLPPSITHTSASAPRGFTVSGIADDCKAQGTHLVHGEFNPNTSYRNTYKVTQKTSEPVSFVRLDITSNHGQEDYTCVYRFRVHGSPAQ